MVPYTGPYLGGEASLMKYVLETGVAMVLGSPCVSVNTPLTSGSWLCMRRCRWVAV